MQNKVARMSSYKVIDFDDVTNGNKTKHHPDWPCISDHSYRILIIGGLRSEKPNGLLNLLSHKKGHQANKRSSHLCGKDPYKAKYQFLTNKLEKVGLKYCNDPKVFIEYSNDLQDV